MFSEQGTVYETFRHRHMDSKPGVADHLVYLTNPVFMRLAGILQGRLIGLVPETNGGFSSAKDAMAVFCELEVVSLTMKFADVNEWFGDEVISFDRPSWADIRQVVEKESALR